MKYLTRRKEEEREQLYADITERLKACAGEIISQALTIEHIPDAAREIMGNHHVHNLVRAMFRDVVVDCLAAYFDTLEESRTEVLEEVVRKTRSEYGTRLRLVQSAMKRTNSASQYHNILAELEQRVTPEIYSQFVAVVREQYSAGR